MENKKYIDKVLDHLLRSTELNYDEETITFLPPRYFYIFYFPLLPSSELSSFSFPQAYLSRYCRDYFGLTKDEIEYVWDKYINIILDKIENGK